MAFEYFLDFHHTSPFHPVTPYIPNKMVLMHLRIPLLLTIVNMQSLGEIFLPDKNIDRDQSALVDVFLHTIRLLLLRDDHLVNLLQTV